MEKTLSNPKNETLFLFIFETSKEIFRFIFDVEESEKYIPTYFSYPTISYFATSGFPRIYHAPFSGLKHYADMLKIHPSESDYHININDLDSFQKLVEHVKKSKHLMDCLHPERNSLELNSNQKTKLSELAMLFIINNLVERYLYLYGSFPLDEEKFTQLFCEIENGIFGDYFPVDIVIPIALTKFQVDEFVLDEHISIERIPDLLQKSRFLDEFDTIGVHETVLGAATHALRLKGWELNLNEGYFANFGKGSIADYPVDHVDNFFSALRLVSKIPSGYAQVIYEPIGWAKAFKTDLPYIYRGPYVRKYPLIFEQNYWNHEDLPAITEADLLEVKKLYSSLMSSGKNQLKIASRRLNACYLRETEEDSILDATIALEALLAGNSKSEISYRLALRLAAISALIDGYEHSPLEIFESIKKIYDFRSAVVHGSSKLDKKRTITVGQKEPVPTISLALDFLQMTLKTLITFPQYLDEKRIDTELLLNVKFEV